MSALWGFLGSEQIFDGFIDVDPSARFSYRLDPERQNIHLGVIASAKFCNHANLEQELRQPQKLESVGRLATNVAHESNPPTRFVNDRVRFLQSAVDDVWVVVAKHQRTTQRMLEGRPENVEVELLLPIEQRVGEAS